MCEKLRKGAFDESHVEYGRKLKELIGKEFEVISKQVERKERANCEEFLRAELEAIERDL